MYLMIDNKDSFVYNLAAYFRELGHEIIVEQADRISPVELRINGIEGIIISPGPGKPGQAEVSLQILKKCKNLVPVLGVCLGHQVIAHAFGGVVCKGVRPMHGKVTQIKHTGKRLFQSLPETFSVTRYHSLVVEESTVRENFYIDAYSQDGAVMAISHKLFPLYGIQFHPEAVLTECGFEILQNFHILCKNWEERNA